jgi:hypothetical protein
MVFQSSKWRFQMSILLSAYFPEGIVFAADKNSTLLYLTPDGVTQDVEPGSATKVFPWPRNKAVVGYVGLGTLAGNSMDEWMRRFIAETADFDDLRSVAHQMRDRVEEDFQRDYPEGTDVSKYGLIIHLGGFTYDTDKPVPAMYHFSNTGLDPNSGYKPATSNFKQPRDSIRGMGRKAGVTDASDYRPWLEQMYSKRHLVWFNNGLWLVAFNIFKEGLWQTLNAVRQSNAVPDLPDKLSLPDRVAYCKMAVDLYGSFFRHHFPPRYRSVGGGVDAQSIAWPEA